MMVWTIKWSNSLCVCALCVSLKLASFKMDRNLSVGNIYEIDSFTSIQWSDKMRNFEWNEMVMRCEVMWCINKNEMDTKAYRCIFEGKWEQAQRANRTFSQFNGILYVIDDSPSDFSQHHRWCDWANRTKVKQDQPMFAPLNELTFIAQINWARARARASQRGHSDT